MSGNRLYESHLIQIVGEDLRYLIARGDSLATDALRRDSVVLRRLIVDGDFGRVWNLLRIPGKPMISAPRLEKLLDDNVLGPKVSLALAGGGQYHGLCAAMAITYAAHVDDDQQELAEHAFTVGEFSSSASIYAGGTRVSRAEVIQYVANKLGGAHLSSTRKGGHRAAYEVLDRHCDRFHIEGVAGLDGLNAVYFELLSIGQLVARSDAALRVVRAIS
jgi:hypothetical protein